MGRLDNKIAIITGSAGGIGRATALKMAAEGASIVVADMLGDGAKAVAEEINASGGVAAPLQVDLGIVEEVPEMIDFAVRTFGGLDILHNNAAATDRVMEDYAVADIDLEVWERTIAVNLRGTMLASKAAIPVLLERGGGCILNTSSISAVAGDLTFTAYGASKGGVNALTYYIATQYGKQNIRCNSIAPGMVLTDGAREKIPPEPLKEYERQHLAPRLGRPEDIANVAAFLASDEAEWITGQVIRVDGGMFSHNPTVAAFRGD
jgi:NAD(P)-dependent dehydrogenase (short-subunit alcohol dehydrogenase family)